MIFLIIIQYFLNSSTKRPMMRGNYKDFPALCRYIERRNNYIKGGTAMNIQAASGNHVITSIEMLNKLLVSINSAAVGLEDKLIKQNVIGHVSGIGECIDRLA